MNTSKVISAIAVLLLVAAGALLFVEHQSKAKLREENSALQKQVEQLTELSAENERSKKVPPHPAPASAPVASNDPSREVLRLRGEVGRLRQDQESEAARHTNGPSPLSSLTANPEMVKMIRQQQKMGMSMIYKDFAKKASLTSDQTEKLNETLADHVMANVDQITAALRDKKTPEQMDQAFTEQESALAQKLQTLLGQDGYAQYQDYTHNLASYLTAEQFKSMMTAEGDAKEQQSKQLYQVMQEETQAALTAAGLGQDFQTVPVLNFRNIASEEEGEKSIKLLDSIYERVTDRAGAFLSAEDLKKFQDFRQLALSNNRLGLAMNRKMMAPQQ